MSKRTVAGTIFRLFGMLIHKLLVIVGFVVAWALIVSGTILLKIGTLLNKLLQ